MHDFSWRPDSQLLWGCSVPWRMNCKSCTQLTGMGQPSKHEVFCICQQVLFNAGKHEEPDTPSALWEQIKLMRSEWRKDSCLPQKQVKVDPKEKKWTESNCYRCVNGWLGSQRGKACVYIAELVLRDSCSCLDSTTDSSSRVRPTSVPTSEQIRLSFRPSCCHIYSCWVTLSSPVTLFVKEETL